MLKLFLFFIELEIFFLFKIKFSSFNNLIQSHLLVASACILPKVFEYWIFQPNLFPFNEHNHRCSTCRVQEMNLCSSNFLESRYQHSCPGSTVAAESGSASTLECFLEVPSWL